MKNTSSTFLTRVRMARILFLFSVCFLSLHSYAANIGAYAQQKNLTIEMRNKTVKEVLDYIEKNSEFFLKSDELLQCAGDQQTVTTIFAGR